MPITTYDNFDLLILPAGDRFQARVIYSPVGQASVAFDLPFSAAELGRFGWLSHHLTRQLRLTGTPAVELLSPEQFGARLFDAVFAGPVRETFLRSLDAVGHQQQGLRIRLRLADAPLLAGLPWEYLYATSLHRFLALSDETPIVRYPELAQPIAEVSVAPPLRILAVVSNPAGVPALSVEREWTRLHDALDGLQSSGQARLERLERATAPALQQRLQQTEAVHAGAFSSQGDSPDRGEASPSSLYRHRYSGDASPLRRNAPVHVLHFIGHGEFDPDANQGSLAFEDEAGQLSWLKADVLAMWLHDHAPLRLVFLNACEGAQSGRQDAFAGVAQVLVQQGVPVVLAMQCEIGDAAAISLAHTFYTGLAGGAAIDTALGEARQALRAAGNDLEWGTPVLFSRSADHQLLRPPLPDALPIIPRLAWEPETVYAPGGPAIIGSDTDAEREKPRHTLALAEYRIGKCPVTHREYAEYLRRNPQSTSPDGWFMSQPPPGKDDHPVVGVSWNDATTYCVWLSRETGRRYRLPSEAEWEAAARSEDGRRYPWGDQWQDGCANVAATDTTPVTTYPAGASPCGCLDLLGNVQEWTSTLWGSDLQTSGYPYPYRADDGREDPQAAGRLFRVYRIHRGGSYRDSPTEVRASARGVSAPESAVHWRGFRVAMQLV